MRSMRLILLAMVLGVSAQAAVAFQQTTVGGGNQQTAAPAAEPPKAAVEPGKGLSLSVPNVAIGKNTGTEVRIPGIGTVGVLPKLDFGLELLYGANDSKGLPLDEKSEPSDVQIRGTIKHRF